MEEEKKNDAIAAEMFSKIWRHFSQLCFFKDIDTAMQWWQNTNDALSSYPWWYMVAESMKGNIEQLAMDLGKESESSGAHPASTTIFNNAHIGQMSGVNECGSKQVYLKNTKS